jgi:hypothetical protein
VTLANGVIVEQYALSNGAAEITVAAHVDVTVRGVVVADGRFEVPPVTARSAELGAALQRVAPFVRALAVDAGAAAVRARKRAGEERRRRLAAAPYGTAWLTVGERLFPAGHPLEGTILMAPAMPLTSVAIAEPPPSAEASLRVTVTLSGQDPRAAVEAERAFGHVLDATHAAIAVPLREDRAALVEPVPATRVVLAWLVPTATDAERAVLRLAMLAVAHNEVGTVARLLVADKHVAAHVRGFVDLGDRASVAALEIVPAVPHSAAEVEAEVDVGLASFADRGPSPAELVAVKAQHRARVQGERARAGSTAEPRDAALARLARLSDQVEGVTGESLAALVKRALTPGHRIVVVTSPRE